jgi:6-phosphogluconolactonase (cycloisomerase 2 family)
MRGIHDIDSGCLVLTLVSGVSGCAIDEGTMKQGEKMSHHMYVSNGGNEYLSKFVMDAATGMLTQEADIALDSNPGAMATTADGTLMFICFRSTKQFQSLRVNKATGALNPISTVSIEAGPPYIKTDNSGRFLLAAYYGAGAVSVNERATAAVDRDRRTRS